jgi:L-fuconolactonase
MELIDAHHHVWNLAAHEQPFLRLPGNEPLLRDFGEADLLPLASAAGVTATVVVQTVAEISESRELLELAARSDLIDAVVGWVDLQADAVGEDVGEFLARPGGRLLRGIRHPVLIEDDPEWLLRPAVLRGLRAVGAAGLCFDLVVPAEVLTAATEAAAACPEVVFVLDHMGIPAMGPRPDERWKRDIRSMAALPNTVCKLSGILGEPPPAGAPAGVSHLIPFYDVALEAFGPQRLMFGSDWPVCILPSSYAGVVAAAMALTAGLSPDDRSAVFAGTARQVYRLDR